MPDPGRDVPLQNIGTGLGALAAANTAGFSQVSQALTAFAASLLFQTYATGTWLPALQFGGSAAGMSITSQQGTWTQLGREFFCKFSLTLAAKGSSTGAAAVVGLPALSNSAVSNSGAGGSIVNYGGFASITSQPFLNVGPASRTASLFQAGSIASIALTDGNFTSVASLSGNFNFFI